MGINRGRTSQLIRLEDASLIEVTSDEYDSRPISSDFASQTQGSLNDIAPMIERACQPVLQALTDVRSKESRISKAEIEIGFNMEPEGNVYIAQVASEASIKVKLTVESSSAQGA